jgi:hypothetical protein
MMNIFIPELIKNNLSPSRLFKIIFICGCIISTHACQSQDIHVWEQVEITLEAEGNYENPYTDVEVWVQLKGPDFDKKVNGFWDGGNKFKVRVTATAPGEWSWTSHSSTSDPGLTGKSGRFTAVSWTVEDKAENPNRRGIVRPTPNGRALMYADNTSFFLLSDTHWATATWRYPFKGVEPAPDYQPAAGIGFEEFIQYMKSAGYNSVGFIACFPNWHYDEHERYLEDNSGVEIRDAWRKPGDEDKCSDMHDEEGNHAFMFPGKCDGPVESCADFDRINPAYWQNLDRKFDYMQDNGFVPYMETIRRDHFHSWMEYHDFNESFVRFLGYIRARYNTHNFIYSLIHGDWMEEELVDQIDEALDLYYEKYGPMPFGQPTTAMAARSTLKFFGHIDESPWLEMHTSGNDDRHHGIYEEMELQFNHPNPIPVFNNEPYYIGHDNPPDINGEAPVINSDRDNYFGRAQMYGNVFSGGLAGHVFGTLSWPGIATGEPAPENPRYAAHWWEPFSFDSHAQMKHLGAFMLSEGNAYWDLIPAHADLQPNRNPKGEENNLDGWAYMLRREDKTIALLYFENACRQARIINMLQETSYNAQWFNTRTGEWIDARSGNLTSDQDGTIRLPLFPNGSNITSENEDWAMKLISD